MPNMTVDWNVFNSKFSSNQRTAFERLAYILFCFEFKQEFGIFRYYNQPYIETQPIELDNGDVVGFQAKYYDAATNISDKEENLKKAIKDARVKYPKINRFLIYTNKDLTTSSKKDHLKPKYQISIEQCGSNIGIQVEWRVTSNFEIMLLDPKLSSVKDWFFNPNEGLQQFAEKINNRSVTLLDGINSEITYNGGIIKIETSISQINDFIQSENKVFVVYGNAGTGKSGFIKDFATAIQNSLTSSLLVFAATDFDVDDEDSLLKQFGDYTLEDLLSLYSPEEGKYCIIESAEKYCNFKNSEILKEVIRKFLEYGWRVFVTIRIQYKEGFNNAILDGIATSQYCIDSIEKNDLKAISEKHGFELPENDTLCDIICNLFYLKLYLRLLSMGAIVPSDSQSFKEMIWEQVIRNESIRRDNLPARRENFVINMASSLLVDGVYVYFAKAADDAEAITELEKQGIIAPYNSAGSWTFNHDVYEEIIVNHIFDSIYETTKEINQIPATFKSSLRSRKMYRIWLESKLDNPDSSLLSSLISVLRNSDFTQSWQDETLIALMNAENHEAFQIMESLFSSNNYALFTRSVFLLNTACKCVKRTDIFIKLIMEQKLNSYHFTEPSGKVWHTIFNYIYRNKTSIPWDIKNLSIILEAMNSWVTNNPTGDTTALIGHTVLYLKENKQVFGIDNDSICKRINSIILLASIEIKEELCSIVDRIIQNKAYGYRDQDYIFLTKVLSNIFDCGNVCASIPNEILQLAWNYWLYKDENNHFPSPGTETDFGLNDHLHFEYHPTSAFQTPLHALLKNIPKQSIDFIINLSNYCADYYKDSSLNKKIIECCEIQIRLTPTEYINQICSDRLWKIHRGTGVAPNVLESILMAFEDFLLNYVNDASEENAKALCLYLLRNSNNVSITAVVLSAILAYPDKLFDISCILLKTKEIFEFDISRLISESSANFFRGMPGNNQLFDKERLASNKKDFRKKAFKDILLYYQTNSNHLSQDVFQERLKKLYTAIDDAIADIDSWSPKYQAYYYGVDLRKYKQSGEIIEVDGNVAIPIQPDLPQQVIEYSEKRNAEYKKDIEDTELMLWSSLRFKKNEEYKRYRKFEENPLLAYQEVKLQLETELSILNIDSIVFTTVVLLRDFEKMLNEEQTAFCQNTLFSISHELIKQNSNIVYRDNLKAAIISGIANLANMRNVNFKASNPIMIVLAFMLDFKKLIGNSFINPLEELWLSKSDLANKLFFTFIRIYPKYAEYDGKDVFQFIKKNKIIIQKHLFSENYTVDTDKICKYDYNTLMYICCINNCNSGILQLPVLAGKHIWKNIFLVNHADDLRHNYQLEFYYMNWLADYLLNISDDERCKIIQELLPYVSFNREFDQFLSDVVSSEDKNPRYDAFWNLWSLIQDSIYQAYEKNSEEYKNTSTSVVIGWGYEDVLLTFLLANPWWREGVSEWHSLKQQNKTFYLVAANRVGFNPTTLFSIARVLYTVGKEPFKDDGIVLLSDIINNNPHLKEKPLLDNTLFYVEEYMVSFLKDHLGELQTDTSLKGKVELVLDFLVTRGSTVGFLLREEI